MMLIYIIDANEVSALQSEESLNLFFPKYKFKRFTSILDADIHIKQGNIPSLIFLDSNNIHSIKFLDNFESYNIVSRIIILTDNINLTLNDFSKYFYVSNVIIKPLDNNKVRLSNIVEKKSTITINDVITLKNYAINKYKSKIKDLDSRSLEYRIINKDIKKIESLTTLNFYNTLRGI